MTLKELMAVIPGYTTVHVHDKEGEFAYVGNPHDFVMGVYKSITNNLVVMCVPIASYNVEVTVQA